jgi:triphosphoribosyl-dephospho-CoA synthase
MQQHAALPLETAIVGTHLHLLAQHPDSLILRKYGPRRASEVSARAASVLEAGWPLEARGRRLCGDFDTWLREPDNRLNPGTTADLVTAVLYASLREGLIRPPFTRKFGGV